MGNQKRTALGVVISSAACLAVMAGTTLPAHADGTDKPNVNITNYSAGATDTSSNATSTARADIKAALTFHWEVTSGKGYVDSKATVIKVNSIKEGIRKTAHMRHKAFMVMKAGDKFQNSGIRTSDGKRTYWHDYIGSKDAQPGTKSATFYYDAAHHTWRKANCGNFVKFTVSMPKLFIKAITVIQSAVRYKATAEEKVSTRGTSTAHAACTTPGSSATADASAIGDASASAFAEAYGSTKLEAQLNAKHQAHSVALSTHLASTVQAQARVNADANVTTKVSALVTCTYVPPITPPPVTPPVTPPTTPPVTPPTPPVDHAPSVSIVGSPAHFYVNGGGKIFLETYDPDGDDVTLMVSGTGGHISGLSKSTTGQNLEPCPTGKTCWDATAWADGAAGTNFTITATATANGKQATYSVTFPIREQENNGF